MSKIGVVVLWILIVIFDSTASLYNLVIDGSNAYQVKEKID